MKLSSILLILAAVAAGFGLIMLLGYIEVDPFNVVYSYVAAQVSGVNLSEVALNPATLLTGVGTAATVGIPLYNKVNQAREQATAIKAQAETQIGSITANLSDATTKLSTADLNLEEAQKKISSLESVASSAEAKYNEVSAQNQKLLTQLEALNNIQAKANILAENKEVTRVIVK